ncbi:MAG TPA: M50 family metallopeptidase, partial [Phycisphaerae bacterium]|nr:M50 family metallopeptidase [Phycisphaerae bacterium]
MMAVRTGAWPLTGLALGTYFAALLLHEFGHYFFARMVGGSHYEFVIWPCGNMVPPNHPPAPMPTLVANAGGIIVNFFMALASGLALFSFNHAAPPILINPAAVLGNPAVFVLTPHLHHAFEYSMAFLSMFYLVNLSLIFVNLLPFFWFDGANLLHAILWPFTGRYRSMNITCIVGMILAIPLILLAVYVTDFLTLVVLVLLFYSSYSRRRQLLADGPAAMEDFGSMGAGYYDVPRPKKKKLSGRWMKWAARKARKERVDQEKIDQILEKVHEKGLHSLTWLEKRTLRKATRRQKERDVEAHR